MVACEATVPQRAKRFVVGLASMFDPRLEQRHGNSSFDIDAVNTKLGNLMNVSHLIVKEQHLVHRDAALIVQCLEMTQL